MDRKSWLWQTNTSEKTHSGETDSSGSASPHSGRFSEDQTVSILNVEFAEVTSKVASGDEHELRDSEKTLSEKLSAALLDIRTKDDLVEQHSKVAEEAVSGWERAENEVVVMKKENDALNRKNSVLEERVAHLDGALKECLRQLRQTREEQEEKIYDAVAKKSSEWESKKSEFETQLVELSTQIRNAERNGNKNNAILTDIQSRLEASEKENSILKAELELRTHERDLSVYATETASKQLLNSIKKVVKLDVECRRLKGETRKATAPIHDHDSISVYSTYEESLVERQSDSGDRCRNGRILNFPPVDMDMMYDFLEMERLAALPEMPSGSSKAASRVNRSEELEGMISRKTELEESLKKIKVEKGNMEIALSECRIQLQASEDRHRLTEVNLENLKTELSLANEATRAACKEVVHLKEKLTILGNQLDKSEANRVRIEDHLFEANEEKRSLESELEKSNLRKEEIESQFKVMELELRTSRSSISLLEREVERERTISKEAVAKGNKLEAEILMMKRDQRSVIIDEFSKKTQEKELAVSAGKFAECQKTIASLDRQLKLLASLEDFVIELDKPATIPL